MSVIVSMYICIMGFPGGLDGQESACNAGDVSSVPGSGSSIPGSPGGGHGRPLVSLPGESHGWLSLGGYGPWRHKQPDVT